MNGVRKISTKTILTRCNDPQSWFGVKYSLNIYRGCDLDCVWCDSRSKCYGLQDFKKVQVKTNAADLLSKELSSKRTKATIGMGTFSDPYMLMEKEYGLARRVLGVIADYRFPLHIKTKNSLILRDIDLLKEINKTYSCVLLTITTTDDSLAGKLEPKASPPSERFKALARLSEENIYSGILLFPVLPFINDNLGNIRNIVEKARDSGAKFIIAWFGATFREGQREFYYESLSGLFPEVRARHESVYKNKYMCLSPDCEILEESFNEMCDKHGIVTRMDQVKKYSPSDSDTKQICLFDVMEAYESNK